MSEKYKNKYRIKSARMPNWDYGWNGAYFITICTKNCEHFFGEIVNDKMQLSQIGEYAKKYLIEIPQHFPFVKLDEFVVMPNHTHGILIIDKMDDDVSATESKSKSVETRLIASLPQTAFPPQTASQPQNCNSIPITFPSLPEQTKIATFLTAVDKRINLLQKKKTELEQYKKGVLQLIMENGELKMKKVVLNYQILIFN